MTSMPGRRPAPAAPQAGTGGGGNAAAARGPVRVYNNSTVTGLAARAANDFRADGWQVGQVANYSSGNIPTSTVYYRPGTAEQSAATVLFPRKLAQLFLLSLCVLHYTGALRSH